MSTRRLSRSLSAAACTAAFAVTVSVALPAAPANGACGLVTPSELETAIGARVTLTEQNAGDVQMCTGRTPTVSVMLRLFKRTDDPSGAKEKAGLEMARTMGAQVDVKTFGPITCTTVVPPATLAEHGFGTTCSIRKAPMFAVVEVTAKTQKDMVPIDRLKPLAEKIEGRF